MVDGRGAAEAGDKTTRYRAWGQSAAAAGLWQNTGLKQSAYFFSGVLTSSRVDLDAVLELLCWSWQVGWMRPGQKHLKPRSWAASCTCKEALDDQHNDAALQSNAYYRVLDATLRSY